MVWALLRTKRIERPDLEGYSFLPLSPSGSATVFAVQWVEDGAPSIVRRRAGYAGAFAAVDGQRILAPSEAIVWGIYPDLPALTLIDFSPLGSRPAIANAGPAYGVYYAPEPWSRPGEFQLWGL